MLSARNEEQLREQVQQLSQFLDQDAQSGIHDIAYTLQVGRAPMEERLAWVSSDRNELQLQLEDYLSTLPNEGCHHTKLHVSTPITHHLPCTSPIHHLAQSMPQTLNN